MSTQVCNKIWETNLEKFLIQYLSIILRENRTGTESEIMKSMSA